MSWQQISIGLQTLNFTTFIKASAKITLEKRLC
jgi:hypothetical protein